MTASPGPDVVIIGAGIVGAMIAATLAETGARVTIIERDFAGGGSTGAAMGHLVVMDDSAAQLALCSHSLTRWNHRLAALPVTPEYRRTGTLWVAADQAELELARQRVDGFRAAGMAAELVDEHGLRRLESALRPGLAGAALVPGDGVCYPPAVARALIGYACERGATLRTGSAVVAIAQREVRLADGSRIAAGATVVAAGCETPNLLRGIPIMPKKGHLVITDRAVVPIRHQLVELGYLASAHRATGDSVAFNVQPRATGQVLIGSSREFVGFDPAINHALLGHMLQRATSYVPALGTARALRSWIGFRPATPDSLPLIGPWRAIRDVWVAAGHEGLGITMATGTADLIAAGILGTPPPVPAAAYDPDRAMPQLAHAA